MSGRLIYRCYRLPGEGYVTLANSGRTDGLRQSDDVILDQLRQGMTPSGCIGLVWDVIVEGRKATEILAFIHNGAIPSSAEQSITSRLQKLKNADLPQAWEMIVDQKQSRSEAISTITQILAKEAGQMSGLLPTQSVPPPKAETRATESKKRIARGIAAVALVFFVITGSLLWWSKNASNPEVGQATVDEIAAVAELCYPGISKRDAELKRLVVALGSASWRPESGVRRDYLRALPASLDVELQSPEMAPEELCDIREKMWSQRSRLDGAKVALEQIKTAVDNVPQEIPAISRLSALTNFVQTNPPPAFPADCAVGLCLPLVSEADVAFQNWIEALQVQVKQFDGLSIEGLAQQIRSEEVNLRGEISLSEGEPEIASANPFWRCNQNHCNFPLLEAASWLRNN